MRPPGSPAPKAAVLSSTVERKQLCSRYRRSARLVRLIGLIPTACLFAGHCHVGECRRPGRIGGVSTATASYKGHRYPVEIINHCVWLYFRFPLSFREVEELMLVRGVVVSYETIRRSWMRSAAR
jgi:hypothetical protein